MAAACMLLFFFQNDDSFSDARERMVRSQIEARGVRSKNVLDAMRTVQRHLFVPSYVQSLAYADRPLPIGHNATISQPYVVAWMTDLLQIDKTHRILEIGTGSGYQAAVLSSLAREVFTIEIVPDLAQSATKRLSDLGYDNVKVRQGDGYQGWPEKAPFDRIILTAAPKEIPKSLLEQLNRGGKLIAPVGSRFGQALTIVDKTKAGALQTRSVGAVSFVPMVPQSAPQ